MSDLSSNQITPLTIDGHQVAALVDFLDLNGGPEGRETELCLRYYAEDRMEPGKHGEPMPAGLYAWFKEYPEEGQLLLVPYEDAVTKEENSGSVLSVGTSETPRGAGGHRGTTVETSERKGCRHCGSTPLATERGRCEECGNYQNESGEYEEL